MSGEPPPGLRPTWLRSDRPVARYLAQPVARFMHVEAAGGIVLALATAVALVWANSPWQDSYHTLWHTELSIGIGNRVLSEDLEHWVNDGLMVLFFFVVGLEIKREWVTGELRDRRAAVLPGLAALGGMVVPAAVYLVVNVGTDHVGGWGIPMATDIAFALGVVAILGSRVPTSLKVFLLTLAIVDDIGAIIVIALFYSDGLEPVWLVTAAVVVVAAILLRRANVRYLPVYIVVGTVLWFALFESGVHATIAGVIMGLLAPAEPFQTEVETQHVVDVLDHRPGISLDDVRAASFLLRESVSVAERVEELLHPWVSYLVIPIFALANAGITFSSKSFSGDHRILLGVVLGLVVGKTVGVSAMTWLGVRLGIGRLPTGVGARHILGIAVVAGIGFTVALFISGLAFNDAASQDQAKIGVLIASVLAAVGGAGVLLTAARPAPGPDDPDA
ncbi:MAG TPA: Na+/H+ antiporter NhaA [Acidimicrobiales bacterium]